MSAPCGLETLNILFTRLPAIELTGSPNVTQVMPGTIIRSKSFEVISWPSSERVLSKALKDKNSKYLWTVSCQIGRSVGGIPLSEKSIAPKAFCATRCKRILLDVEVQSFSGESTKKKRREREMAIYPQRCPVQQATELFFFFKPRNDPAFEKPVERKNASGIYKMAHTAGLTVSSGLL